MFEDDPELQGRAQQMLEHCEVVNVLLIQLGAERFRPADAHEATISSRTQYTVDENDFANRYEWRAEIKDEDGELVAELTATLLVQYEIQEGFQPDPEAAEAIASTTGFFAAYPYVREIFQSSCGRLQLDPFVLGMLMAHNLQPGGVSNPKGVDVSEPNGNPAGEKDRSGEDNDTNAESAAGLGDFGSASRAGSRSNAEN